MAINNPSDPTTLSKMDQLGRGVEAFVRKTGCDVCPVTAVIAYSLYGREATHRAHFSDLKMTRAKFIHAIREVLQMSGLP